jgi:uncharacterized protein YcaQ
MAHRPSKVVVSKEKARRLFLKKQLLIGSRIPRGKAGALYVIEKLGYVQIDTINVIERSHHLVLYTRSADYDQQYLHSLHAHDKRIFEYWGHGMSYVPIKDYRYYLPVIQRKPRHDSWADKWTKKNQELVKSVYKRVEKEGPLTPSDFGDVENRKRGSWWDWKPAKTALEILFWRGDLMIKERRNFQRVYDLTERILPGDAHTTMPSEEEVKKFFIERALGAMGIATVQDMNRYIGISGKLQEWIAAMHGANEIIEVEIEGLKKPYYLLRKDSRSMQRQTEIEDNKVRLLSPFDNSIILRDRTEALFDFKYSLECYTPRDNRKYGYFCLPVLWRGHLIGRVDPKADRNRRDLLIHSVHLDKNIDEYVRFLSAFAESLNRFCKFNGCEHIKLNANVPRKIARRLSSNLI